MSRGAHYDIMATDERLEKSARVRAVPNGEKRQKRATHAPSNRSRSGCLACATAPHRALAQFRLEEEEETLPRIVSSRGVMTAAGAPRAT